MKQKNKNRFIMDTDWLFDGILDAEQKQYIDMVDTHKFGDK